jgi:hypothetical protein
LRRIDVDLEDVLFGRYKLERDAAAHGPFEQARLIADNRCKVDRLDLESVLAAESQKAVCEL